MGDTFSDCRFVAPKKWGKYELIDVDNTKWEGNRYIYQWEDGDRIFRIDLWSKRPDEIRLTGNVYYDSGTGLQVYYDYSYAMSYWDNFDKAMTQLDNMLTKLVVAVKNARVWMGEL